MSKIVYCINKIWYNNPISFWNQFFEILPYKNSIIMKNYSLCDGIWKNNYKLWMNKIIALFLRTSIQIKLIIDMSRSIGEWNLVLSSQHTLHWTTPCDLIQIIQLRWNGKLETDFGHMLGWALKMESISGWWCWLELKLGVEAWW